MNFIFSNEKLEKFKEARKTVKQNTASKNLFSRIYVLRASLLAIDEIYLIAVFLYSVVMRAGTRRRRHTTRKAIRWLGRSTKALWRA